jgi:hypothetical protein
MQSQSLPPPSSSPSTVVLSLLLAPVCFIFAAMVCVLGLYGGQVSMRLVMPKAAYMMSLFREFRIVV